MRRGIATFAFLGRLASALLGSAAILTFFALPRLSPVSLTPGIISHRLAKVNSSLPEWGHFRDRQAWITPRKTSESRQRRDRDCGKRGEQRHWRDRDCGKEIRG